jgi:hypothetical protein
MTEPPTYEKGDVARIRVTFEDDEGNVIKPDLVNGQRDVSLLIKRIADDKKILGETQMEELSDTQFQFDFQTTQGTRTGEYSVKVSASFNNENDVNRDRFRVTDILDQNIGQ